MKRFCEWCTKAKVVAAEIVITAVFFVVLYVVARHEITPFNSMPFRADHFFFRKWSVLAGGGSIASGGLFTAPTRRRPGWRSSDRRNRKLNDRANVRGCFRSVCWARQQDLALRRLHAVQTS